MTASKKIVFIAMLALIVQKVSSQEGLPIYSDYLTDNYYTNKSVQLTSIWFFLRDLESQDYHMHCTKEDYKNYVKTHYNFEIKHFDKPSTWSDVKRILNDFRINFENT